MCDDMKMTGFERS